MYIVILKFDEQCFLKRGIIQMDNDRKFIQNGKYLIEEANLDTMQSIDNYEDFSLQYIGSPDAKREWDKNPELTGDMFIHTRTYHAFKDEDNLILLGRTGTGKTAILRCLEWEVRHNSSDFGMAYNIAVMIEAEQFLKVLALYEMLDTNSTAANLQISEALRRIVYLSIMEKILDSCEKPTQYQAIYRFLTSAHELRGNLKYTKSQQARDKASIFAQAEILGTATEFGTILKDVQTVTRLFDILYATNYEAAREECKGYLNNKKVLVLIDTFETYDLSNAKMIQIIRNLLEVCFEFYNNPTKNIFVKIALPIEIYNRVLYGLPPKKSSNTVVIRWTNRELLAMVALRIVAGYQQGKLKGVLEDQGREILFDYCEQFSLSDFYADREKGISVAYENARNLLQNILPKECVTRCAYSCDAILYCMKHTLKKPRELMKMFDGFISQIIKNNNRDYYKINNGENIRDTVHAMEEYMIRSALSVYEDSYRGLGIACDEFFTDAVFVFEKNTPIVNKLKAAIVKAKEANWRHLTPAEQHTVESLLDETTFISVLMESGLIGEINSKKIQVNEKFFDANEPTCTIIADFEFKITRPNNYQLFAGRQYVIHPMCYEYYSCKVDRNTFVYLEKGKREAPIYHSQLIDL